MSEGVPATGEHARRSPAHGEDDVRIKRVRHVAALYDMIEATARQIAALEAIQLRQIAELAEVHAVGRRDDGRIIYEEFLVDELAVALRWTTGAADRHLDLASDVANRLPGTLDALGRGDIDLPRVRVMADATRPVPADRVPAIEARLLPRAAHQNPSELRRAAAKAVVLVDPLGAEERHRRRRADRRVEISPAADGMSELWALLPGEDATRIKVRLDAFAREIPRADGRTMDQRRADVLTDLLLSRSAGRVSTTVHVAVPANLLAPPRTRRSRPIPACHPPRRSPASTSAASRVEATSQQHPDPRSDSPDVPRPTIATRAPAVPLGATTDLSAITLSAATLSAATLSAATLSAATPGTTDLSAATPGTTDLGTTDLGTTTPVTADLGTTDLGTTTTLGSSADVAEAVGRRAPDAPAPVDAQPLGDDVATLAGYGVITAHQAMRLAARDATWRRLLTDPVTGAVIDLGRRSYKPSAALADIVRARDPYCVFPGCSVPAERCDLDHRVPFPEGPTSRENLNPLCRHHHRLKHESAWTVRRDTDGSYSWTSPREVEYVNRPPPIVDRETADSPHRRPPAPSGKAPPPC
jgi:Domain of unknown function (DUF222)